MTEQELREKIVNTITNVNNICRIGCVCKNCKYENYDNCTEYAIADALIAANIGYVSEWKHRAEVLRLALSKSVLDENAIFDDDVCRYILSNTRLTEEYYIEQAEKELAEEERKDENSYLR